MMKSRRSVLIMALSLAALAVSSAYFAGLFRGPRERLEARCQRHLSSAFEQVPEIAIPATAPSDAIGIELAAVLKPVEAARKEHLQRCIASLKEKCRKFSERALALNDEAVAWRTEFLACSPRLESFTWKDVECACPTGNSKR